jgi:hypothetical protein
MKLVTKDGMKIFRQNKSCAKNAGSNQTDRTATKQNRTDRTREKSVHRSTRANRQVGSWHKNVEVLLESVELAWAAAERMRAAVEDYDPKTGRVRGKSR